MLHDLLLAGSLELHYYFSLTQAISHHCHFIDLRYSLYCVLVSFIDELSSTTRGLNGKNDWVG